MGDLISQLPNELLHKVLLNLTTRESVRTSVLSTRWTRLWQSVPGLNGDERDVKYFLDRFLNLHKELSIYQFTLRCSYVERPGWCSYVERPGWKLLIDQVLTRGVQFLKINCLRVIKLPLSFYTCETLVNLHLACLKLDGSEFINLPHLQVMHLQTVLIPSDVVLEMLISCSPVLRELRLYNMNWRCLKLRSQTLRSLGLTKTGSRIVIYTPNLEFLKIRDQLLENLSVKSVSSSIKICIGVHFNYVKDNFSNKQTLHKFFTVISSVTDLSISGYTLYDTYHTYSKALSHQLLPEFKNLTRLYAFFCSSYSEMLPLFLSSCPNLKYVALELCYLSMTMKNEFVSSPVPQCLQTSIENVKLKINLLVDKERGRKAETEFAKFILQNAKALKKLTIWLDEEEDVCSSVLEQILTFRNRPSVDVMIHRVTSTNLSCYYFN